MHLRDGGVQGVAARITPADVRTLDDFREKVPFISKDAVRDFRDRRADPYGGLLCLPPAELTAIMSTSGTTGDPTLVAERWGGGGGTGVMGGCRTRVGWFANVLAMLDPPTAPAAPAAAIGPDVPRV